MLSRNGITYNLKLSPYEFTIKYSNGENIKYKFSSLLYRDKFIDRYEGNRETISRSLSKRFGIDMSNEILCDLKLYSSIEKRGFYLETKEGFYSCLNTIKLDGQNKIQKRSAE